jgi:hypothetical protein
MKKIYASVVFAGIVLVTAGCKSASKLYDKGNYDEAVELAVKKLQKNTDNGETIALLQNAYRNAVNDHENRVRQLSDNSNELKWEWIYSEYSSLQKLYEAIRRSPDAMAVVHAKDYSDYLATYGDKAAGVRYQRGLQWMEKNDKMSFRNAYHEFNAALRFRPADRALTEKRTEAYENAIINVVVIPFENYSYRYSSYNDYGFRNFENELLNQLRHHTGNQFVKVYSLWEARSRNIRPDQFIDFRFTTFNSGRIKDENHTREVSKDVVVKETVYRPDSVVKEYKKVFARITTTKRSMYSDGILQIHIRDAEGRWLWSDDVRGDHTWHTEFATFAGDERALSDSDKELVNRRHQSPPHEDEIIRHIINEINSSISSRIRNYYTRL